MTLTIISILVIALVVIFGFPYIATLLFHHSIQKATQNRSSVGTGGQQSEPEDDSHVDTFKRD